MKRWCLKGQKVDERIETFHPPFLCTIFSVGAMHVNDVCDMFLTGSFLASINQVRWQQSFLLNILRFITEQRYTWILLFLDIKYQRVTLRGRDQVEFVLFLGEMELMEATDYIELAFPQLLYVRLPSPTRCSFVHSEATWEMACAMYTYFEYARR